MSWALGVNGMRCAKFKDVRSNKCCMSDRVLKQLPTLNLKLQYLNHNLPEVTLLNTSLEMIMM